MSVSLRARGLPSPSPSPQPTFNPGPALPPATTPSPLSGRRDDTDVASNTRARLCHEHKYATVMPLRTRWCPSSPITACARACASLLFILPLSREPNLRYPFRVFPSRLLSAVARAAHRFPRHRTERCAPNPSPSARRGSQACVDVHDLAATRARARAAAAAPLSLPAPIACN